MTGGLTTTRVDEAGIRWQNGLVGHIYKYLQISIIYLHSLQVGKLHALTGSMLFLFSVTVFTKELLGDHIRCTRCGHQGQCGHVIR